MRVLAQQHGPQQALHRRFEDSPAGAAHIAKTDAFDAIGGTHLNEAIVPRGDGAVRERGDFVQRHRGGAYVDGFNDGHGRLLEKGKFR
ncbi:hypothetical protein D3C71_1993000 [compost metagenome]